MRYLRPIGAAVLGLVGLAVGLADAREGRLRFDHLTMDQGLSNGFVQAIIKDSRGFVWFGTADGLNRYDGGTPPRIYKHDPDDSESLPATSAGAIFEDSQKRLWVGSGWVPGGFALFDRDTDRFQRIVPNPGHTGGNQTRCFLEDKQGSLWVGTDNGLVEVDAERREIKRRYPRGPEEASGNARNIVRSLFEDRRKQMWVGTDAGLLRFDRRSGEFSPWTSARETATGLETAEISSFYEDESGGLWIATKAGLHLFDSETGRDTAYLPDPNDPDSISHAGVTRLAPDGQGGLYVGTEGGALNRLDGDAQVHAIPAGHRGRHHDKLALDLGSALRRSGHPLDRDKRRRSQLPFATGAALSAHSRSPRRAQQSPRELGDR